MPYLTHADTAFEESLQKVFDRSSSRLPVLLVLIGSDLVMMEALNTYGRPFYQRLVPGGLPLILEEWPHGARLCDYLARR